MEQHLQQLSGQDDHARDGNNKKVLPKFLAGEEDAMKYIDLMESGPDLLVTMNECIIANKKIGLYDGCKNAVKLAMELANEKPAAKAKTPSKSPAKRASASPARR